jgi:hypothetical protein
MQTKQTRLITFSTLLTEFRAKKVCLKFTRLDNNVGDVLAAMAAKSFHWSLLATAVALVLCLPSTGADENPWATKTPMSVLIYNDMPGGVVVVDCECRHCHNLNTVLTQHSLPWRNGFEFQFKMSIWGNTYVWCKFVHGQLWNAFKVWTGPGLWGQHRMPCQQCVLELKTAGIYQGKTGADQSLVRPWLQDPPPMD